MTPREIAKYRLLNQRIANSSFKEPVEVVSRLGAMQAQDYLGALWAVGLRLPDSTESDVEQAIADGKIIRTWPLRGTLHFVSAEDVRWMLSLSGLRMIAGSAGRHKQLELDGIALRKSQDLIVDALKKSGLVIATGFHPGGVVYLRVLPSMCLLASNRLPNANSASYLRIYETKTQTDNSAHSH